MGWTGMRSELLYTLRVAGVDEIVIRRERYVARGAATTQSKTFL